MDCMFCIFQCLKDWVKGRLGAGMNFVVVGVLISAQSFVLFVSWIDFIY